MSAENVPCSDIEDCLAKVGLQDCYPKNTLALNKSVCGCSPYFGWVGELCDEESAILYYNRVATIFLAVCSFVVLLLGIRTMTLNFLVEGFTCNKLFLTLLFSCSATIGILTYQVTRIPGLFDPMRFENITFDHLLTKEQKEIEVENVFIVLYLKVLGMAIVSAAIISLMLSWEEVINKVSLYRSPKSKQLAVRQVIFLEIAGIIYVALIITLLALRAIRGCIIALSVINIVLILAFIRISHLFINSLIDVCKGIKHPHFVLVINFVKKIRFITALCLVTTSAANATFLVMRDYVRLQVKPGEFHITHFARDISTTGSITMYLVIIWYVNSVSAGPIIAEEFPKWCFMFKWWDAKNLELIPDKIVDAETTGQALTSNQEDKVIGLSESI